MKLAAVLVFCCFLWFSNSALTNGAITKHYIVYAGNHQSLGSKSIISSNHQTLASITGSTSGAKDAMVHHYTKSFRGFSAMLTTEQAQKLAESGSVISVFESRTNPVHTTHSWDFLQVDSVEQFNHLPVESKSDVIVGMIDTGVWPESESFADKGFGPIPKRFKGECAAGDKFTVNNCNKKLIGARFYSKGFEAENGPLESFKKTFFRSPRDTDGHGSHTASIVAGSVVNNVSLLGIATGTARGGFPSARLAIYKACWFNLCSDADLLSAFDDATSDGVDIISISVGPIPPQTSFFNDAISIGAFHAFRKGVLVSASAGNFGLPSTATNVAPWILTVAASSINREFNSNVHLGNSQILQGFSLNPLKMESNFGVVAAAGAAAPGIPAKNASFCKNNTLDPNLVKGKIVVCTIETILDDRGEMSTFVRQAGGIGMIIIDPIAKDVGFQFVLPATLIGQQEAELLQAYLATSKNPTAKIYPTTTLFNTRPAPEMAVFSSMGPNVITPDIIKPDITAPGLNILAAWSPLATKDAGERSVAFNIISGTSMSCPHVSALAAIIKACHPHWSPSAIKSAIMTTATVQDHTGKTILRQPNGSPTTPFDYGSGHIHPVAALNPGLVYDFDSNDITDFLCSSGASPEEIQMLNTWEPSTVITCKNPPVPSYNLNYPSISLANMNGSVTVMRTVTYYGEGPTTFKPIVEKPAGVEVTVRPYKLNFKEAGENKTYWIRFDPYINSNGSFVFGAITWTNGFHKVRSPIGINVLSV